MYETLAAFCQEEAYLLSCKEFVRSGKETSAGKIQVYGCSNF